MEDGRPDLERALEGLVAIAVGTRDEELRPCCTTAVGVRVDPSGRKLTVYLPEATAGEALANLRANGAVAVVLDRPTTHRSVQVKGRCVEVRPAAEDERPVVERCMDEFSELVEGAGAPRRLIRRMRRWPARAVTLEVSEVFEQTPGPLAGVPLAPGDRA